MMIISRASQAAYDRLLGAMEKTADHKNSFCIWQECSARAPNITREGLSAPRNFDLYSF
jgi:hypothetical protein